jgi:cation/acetate symporter
MASVSDRRLRTIWRYYGFYAFGFFAFLGTLALLEQLHLIAAHWIGYAFLFFTILLYATIGITARTSDVNEYYVAGRRVPAVFNGMATAADWMSAASFIGLAGTLYLSGHQGLAYVMGWVGGYVLVALLLAPYLRRFGQYTVPDFLGERFQSQWARLGGVGAAILASFVYVVAQMYGIGLITSRLVGLQFEVGVFVGLAGVLACSFLGGMRAITWTQVMQYLILVVAYLVPLSVLSYQATGNPIPQIAFGQVLQEVGVAEQRIFDTQKEYDARDLFAQRAVDYRRRLESLPESLQVERSLQTAEVARLKQENAPLREVMAAERARRDLPVTPEQAQVKWRAAEKLAEAKSQPPVPHAEAFPAPNEAASAGARINFIALVFCLMLGTAALPHVLVRYYTTPSVREARASVFWSVVFILVLYLAAPAYAVFAKHEVYTNLIGSQISQLPAWVSAWGKVGLVAIDDINRDGILQLTELTLNPDVIVLATPEIAGLPYVLSGLIAAGAMAAALSTADALLLTITSALSHDVYYRVLNPGASTQLRLVVSKSMLLVVTALAAIIATQRPATILNMVAWAFSIAGAALFPAMVLGIFWKRANAFGAVAGMTVGLCVTLFYMIRVEFDSIPWLGLYGLGMEPWLGVQSTAAGIWGVPAGFATVIICSLLTRPPSERVADTVDRLRYPPIRPPASNRENALR